MVGQLTIAVTLAQRSDEAPYPPTEIACVTRLSPLR